MRELPVPPAATRDEKAVEMIRCWVAEGGQWIVINPHLFRGREFSEESAWGMFLADSARHIARAIALNSGQDEGSTVAQIREAFERELAKPTSPVTGGFLEDDEES